MVLGLITSNVAPYKVSMPLLTLGQVGVRCVVDVVKFTENSSPSLKLQMGRKCKEKKLLCQVNGFNNQCFS